MGRIQNTCSLPFHRHSPSSPALLSMDDDGDAESSIGDAASAPEADLAALCGGVADVRLDEQPGERKRGPLRGPTALLSARDTAPGENNSCIASSHSPAVLPEVVREVARFLGPKDRLVLALVSKSCYIHVAPLMFRTLDFHAAAVRRDNRLADQHWDFWKQHRAEFRHALLFFGQFFDSAAPPLPKDKLSYVRRLVLSRDVMNGATVTVPFALFGPLLPMFTNLRDLSCDIESEEAFLEFVQADLSTLVNLDLSIYIRPSREGPIGTRFADLRECQYRGRFFPAFFAALEAQKQDRVVLDIHVDHILAGDGDHPGRFPEVSDWVASRMHTLWFDEWNQLHTVLLRDALKPRRIFSDSEIWLDEGACRDVWELLVRKGGLESADVRLFSSCAFVHGLPSTLKTLWVLKLRLCRGNHGDFVDVHGDIEFGEIEAAIRAKPQGCVLDIVAFVVEEYRDGEAVDEELDEDTDPEASVWRLLVGPARGNGGDQRAVLPWLATG
ncbi:hypothetical protein DFJ74DRAFT_438324 [Hyaloraphidium curvatum]|nr:hypothetical protein DFJ74DRAFT_438324 [Hyaloraphidium curvatum]